MSIRRIAVLTLALAMACVRSVEHEATPASIDYAVFDPATGEIPLPNELALASAPTMPDGAQKDLLLAFAAQKGFPNDMEVPITVDFTRTPVAGGASTAVGLKPESVNRGTVVLLKLTATGAVPAAYDAAAVTQTQGGAKTTLRLRAPRAADGSRNWEPGAHYLLAVRGGPQGVKTTDDQEIHPMPVMSLLLSGKPLDDAANQTLLPDPAVRARLEAVRQSYLPAFMVLDAAVFPARELAVLTTFKIAPAEDDTKASTYVRVDSTAGVVPLPFDLLRTDADGTIVNNPGFGSAAAGLDTLHGFSTTAMMLAPTSGPIDAGTVTGANVFLFRMRTNSGPTLVKDLLGALTGGGTPGYVLEPDPITAACASASGKCSTIIGLQPAVVAPTPLGSFTLPPLAENTEYAVVITKGVKDAAGNPLRRSTMAKILLDVEHPISVAGASQLSGVDDAQAAMLDHMRGQLANVFPLLPGGKTKADVAMAYTFKTQPISADAITLAQVPYAPAAAAAGIGAVTGAQFFTAAQAAADYGVNAALLPAAAVPEVAEATFVTLDLLNPGQSGAFDPAHPTPTPVTALVAIPPAAAVTGTCPSGIASAKCAPLVIFHHGITRSRGDMLFMAANLTSRGFVVAAIDSAKHGDRTYCSASSQCVPGDVCVPVAALGSPVDAVAPGVCQTAGGAAGALLRHRADCAASNTSAACFTASKGLPFASGNYLVSLNLFRTRDTLRQDIVDETALALALARPVALRGGAALDALASHLDASYGLAIDPTRVYMIGHSLGAMQTALTVATNPRITRAVLAEGGATAVDIFASPASAFHQSFIALLGTSTPPIVEGSPTYLQFLQLAKWILDPADPANFAGTLLGDAGHPRLPIGLPFAPAQPAQVLAQAALCDATIPNAQNALLAGLIGIPVPSPATTGSGDFQWFVNAATGATCPTDAVSHSILFDFSVPTLTQQAQAAAASFLSTGAAQATPVRP